MDDLNLNELINNQILKVKNLIHADIEQNIVNGMVTQGKAQEALEECLTICCNLLEQISKNIDYAIVYESAAEETYQYYYIEPMPDGSFIDDVLDICDRIIKNSTPPQRYIFDGRLLDSSIITAKFEEIKLISLLLEYHELD